MGVSDARTILFWVSLFSVVLTFPVFLLSEVLLSLFSSVRGLDISLSTPAIEV
jgi:hypothetical protein